MDLSLSTNNAVVQAHAPISYHHPHSFVRSNRSSILYFGSWHVAFLFFNFIFVVVVVVVVDGAAVAVCVRLAYDAVRCTQAQNVVHIYCHLYNSNNMCNNAHAYNFHSDWYIVGVAVRRIDYNRVKHKIFDHVVCRRQLESEARGLFTTHRAFFEIKWNEK